MNPRRLLGGFAAAFLSLAATGARAQTATSLDARVQSPELKAPERGSIAGQLAKTVFGPTDVTRGAFTLPSPLAAPSERGALGAEIFPTYALDHPLSEWGQGWSATLSMTRFRISGDLDYRTDELTGPFGRLVQGTDGYWYPLGMSKAVRVAWSGDSIVATLPSGTRMTFGGTGRVLAVAGKGTYAWYLATVETVTGQRTRLDYQANASGRLFLTSAWYGGHGDGFQHRIDVEYESLPVPFKDYGAGAQILLDRRVKRVAALSKHAVTGLFAERWHFDLAFADDGLGPAFYLSNVQQEFASGERPPPTTYQHRLGKEALAAAAFVENPKLMPVLSAFQADVIQADKSAVIDLDQDGMPDLERAYDQQLIRQTDAGWSYEPLPWVSGTYSLCRPGPSTSNPPRALASLRASEDATHVVSLVYDRTRMLTAFTACDRAGVKLSTQTLPNDWSLSGTTRLADLNRDHQPDLVRVFQGGFQALPNTSTPAAFSFGAMKSGALSPSIALAAAWVHDFNGDGIADLVARTSGSLVVWHGKGNLEFEQAGQSFVFQTIYGPLLLSDYSVTFVDSNKDGLTDVLLTKAVGNATYLFVNRGTALQQAAVPGLAAVGQSASKPVAADFSGSGNTEIAYAKLGRAYVVALDDPSTGLLQSADDGKGTVLRFVYARAKPAAGTRRRQTVMSRLTVESSGYDAISYSFAYRGPRVHSAGKFLLGFDQVTRTDPLVTSTGTFLNDDQFSGIFLTSFKHDINAPGVDPFETRSYEDATFQGVPWKRLKQEITGYRDATGATVSETTDYLSYVNEICPQVVRHSQAAGTLTTTRSYSTPASFGSALACLWVETVQQGAHPDSTLDFRHETALARNSVGFVEKVESISGSERWLLETSSYRPSDWLIDSITRPGKGTITLTYDPTTRLLSGVASPDGVVVSTPSRDPLHDGILTLRTTRGSLTFQQFFHFDGQERLASRWDDLGSSSQLNPAASFSYQFATATRPAAIFSSELVDAQSTSARDAVALLDGAGEPVVTARRTPEGWSFGSLITRDKTKAETRHLLKPSIASPLDPAALDYASLLGDASQVGSSIRSGLDFDIDAQATYHAGVEQRLTRALALSGGLLALTATENGALSTRSFMDAGRRVRAYEDEASARYTYTYDALGRLRVIELPDGKKHRVKYDGHGRVFRIERDGVANIEQAFDATSGLPTVKKHFTHSQYQPANDLVRTVSYAYDGIGRVKTETHTDAGGAPTKVFTYYYDGSTPSAPAARTELGLLTAVTGDGFTKAFEHRPDGKVLRQRLTLGTWRSVEITFSYLESAVIGSKTVRVSDGTGSLLSKSASSYGFDAHGRWTTASLNGELLASLSYDGNGNLAGASFANGDALTLSYDPLTRILVGSTSKNAAAVASTSKRMNARGLVEAESFASGGTSLSRSYAYSPQRFLTGASDALDSYAYAFDASGFPTSVGKGGAIRAIVESGNTLNAGTVSYGFDGLHRTVSRSDAAAPARDVTFAYGADGQLASATKGSVTHEYVHDEAGRRLLKLAGGVPVAAFLAEGYLDSTGLTERFQVGGRTVGVIQGGVFTSVFTDLRGSVMAEASGDARLASPFGQRDARPVISAAIDYVEKGHDADLGLVRMGARDYDPEINRFTTADPLFLEAPEKCIESPVECNLFTYARGTPTVFTDPEGEEVEVVPEAGHHLVPKAIIQELYDAKKITLEAADYLRKQVTGWVKDVPGHQWSEAHRVYSDKIREMATDFLKHRKGTAEDVAKFIAQIRTSEHPAIRRFLAAHEKVIQMARDGRTVGQINSIWVPMRVSFTKAGGFVLKAANIGGKAFAYVPYISYPLEYIDVKQHQDAGDIWVPHDEFTPLIGRWVPHDQAYLMPMQ